VTLSACAIPLSYGSLSQTVRQQRLRPKPYSPKK
jgi:hypothetical protein